MPVVIGEDSYYPELARRDKTGGLIVPVESRLSRGIVGLDPSDPRFEEWKLIADANRHVMDAFYELHDASKNGHVATVARLLKAGTPADILLPIDMSQNTPLMWAAGRDHLRVVRLLIQHGAEINYQNDSGWTSLMSAAWDPSVSCISFLLDHGAGPDLRNHDGMTALDIAERSRTGILFTMYPQDCIVTSPAERKWRLTITINLLKNAQRTAQS